MSFGSPLFLWGLLLLPPAVWAYLALQRRRVRYAIRFTNLEILARVNDPRKDVRRYISPALFLVALASLLLGLARPQATVVLPREQATVILTLDSSGSMEARDVEPSRLGAMKQAAEEFLNQLPPKFQVGVVSFAGRAQILAQPTTDRTAVRDAIQSLRASGATAIGDAIVRSLSLDPRAPSEPSPNTERRRKTPRSTRPLAAIVLLSDGSNTAGSIDPLDGAARARRMGLPVFTIALGPEEGTEKAIDPTRLLTIPPPDYKTLRAIAHRTEAKYFSAPTQEDLRGIYDRLASRLGFVKDRQEVTFAFAAAGLVFAGAATFLSALWSGRFP